MTVSRFVERETRYIGFRLLRRFADAGGRADQDWSNEPQPRRFDYALYRDPIAGMRDRCRDRWKLPRGMHGPVVSLVRPVGLCCHGVPPISAALSWPSVGGGPANIASMRSSLRRPSSGRAPRAASTRRTIASA